MSQVRTGRDGGREFVPKPAGCRYAVCVREVRMVRVRVRMRARIWVCMGLTRKRRRRREPLVLCAGRPHRVFPPPLDRLGSRKRFIVLRPIRVRRRRNRHIVLVLLLLAAQIRYPRPRTRTHIGGRAIHAAAPGALGRRVLPRRGRTRLRAFPLSPWGTSR